jgi:hypothetical protein
MKQRTARIYTSLDVALAFALGFVAGCAFTVAANMGALLLLT